MKVWRLTRANEKGHVIEVTVVRSTLPSFLIENWRGEPLLLSRKECFETREDALVAAEQNRLSLIEKYTCQNTDYQCRIARLQEHLQNNLSDIADLQATVIQ